MATLTVQTISRSGITPTYASAAGGGDQFLNDGDIYIEVINAHSSPQTVTIVTQATIEGVAIADVAVAVTNAERRKIGPFPPSIFNDASGYCQLTYSGVTSLTVGVFKL